jgi:hypothetical protein
MDGIGTGGATGGVSLLIVDTGNAAEISADVTAIRRASGSGKCSPF